MVHGLFLSFATRFVCSSLTPLEQLGYGHVWDRTDPVMIVGLRSVVELSCGSRHSVALVDRVTTNDATDGEIYCWGFNDCGELGLGGENGGQVSDTSKDLFLRSRGYTSVPSFP